MLGLQGNSRFNTWIMRITVTESRMKLRKRPALAGCLQGWLQDFRGRSYPKGETRKDEKDRASGGSHL